jgi:hypothetical protein
MEGERRAYHGKKRAFLSMTTAFFVLAGGEIGDATRRAQFVQNKTWA